MANFANNASGATWWPNVKPVQVGGQICNLYKWRHLVAKFATYTSGAIWCPKNATNASGAMLLLNLIPSHGVHFWVRCASGNVYLWSTYFHWDIERGKNCTKMDTRPTSPDTEKEVNCKWFLLPICFLEPFNDKYILSEAVPVWFGWKYKCINQTKDFHPIWFLSPFLFSQKHGAMANRN